MNRYFAGFLFLGVSLVARANPLSGVSSLASGYLVEDQVNYRVSFSQTGKVGLQKDANTCSVDTYGRTGGCTRMFFAVDEYDAKELSSVDGLTLYDVSAEFRLVLQRLGAGGTSAYLLKVDPKGEVLKRIPLFNDVY